MKALVLGAGGFIGGHLVHELVDNQGIWTRAADIKYHEFRETDANEFVLGDLRDLEFCKSLFRNKKFDLVFQLAADMGGAGYVFTGEHDADIMHNSAQINLNIAECARIYGAQRIFYSSSACIYPQELQIHEIGDNGLKEEYAFPANPDSEYGWEKIFSERLWRSYSRNYGLQVRIARFHNIFGPYGTWEGGREKAPAAMCRKVAEADRGGSIEVWGDGEQTRTFLYVDECVKGIMRLMLSGCEDVVNIGSEELISINNLARMAMDIADKPLEIIHIDGPIGVRGRSSDNAFISEKLNWKPSTKLIDGMRVTYRWIEGRVAERGKA